MNTILILIAAVAGSCLLGVGIGWAFERRVRRTIPPIVGHREEDWQ